MKYLTSEQVLFIHSRLIDATGGCHGIRDTGLLKSAAARPQATFEGRDLYSDIFHKTAALMESLVKNHAFIDGNKRTAITSCAIFLEINGYSLTVSQKKLEHFALDMATDKTSFNDAVRWFSKHSDK